MKFTLKKSKRYRGFRLIIQQDEEALSVENPQGNPVARFVLDDFLDRIGANSSAFKRKYPRLGLGIHVRYFDAEGHLCEGIASSIGGGGLFIEQLNPLVPGNETRLEFTLPASKNLVSARAQVVWVRRNFQQRLTYPGMGLTFTQISERDRAELIHFVNTFNEQRGYQED